MNHTFYKFLLYFNKTKYWKSIEIPNFVVPSKLGSFFNMSYKDRLYDNHYDLFDEKGYPIRKNKKGEIVYNYTTLSSYAFANWQEYLETGEVKHLEPLYLVLDYLKSNHEVTDYGGVLFTMEDRMCAMSQGLALGVVARVYELTKDESLKDFAHKIILPYDKFIQERGVKGDFKEVEGIWYEESAEIPYKHILNGMAYAMMGLYDIMLVMPELEKAKEMWDKGVKSLVNALPLFDTGRWSNYWYDETNSPHYIASAMYHNLHICQLNHLYDLTGIEEIGKYARVFEAYDKNILNRILAGAKLVSGKLRMR